MKKQIIYGMLLLCFTTSFGQNIKGDWILESLTVKGGEHKITDKMFQGEGLELHLGKKSLLLFTVIKKDKSKEKYKSTWCFGDEFIIFNDEELGNASYTILDASKDQLKLERIFGGGVEMILELVRKSKDQPDTFTLVRR